MHWFELLKENTAVISLTIGFVLGFFNPFYKNASDRYYRKELIRKKVLYFRPAVLSIDEHIEDAIFGRGKKSPSYFTEAIESLDIRLRSIKEYSNYLSKDIYELFTYDVALSYTGFLYNIDILRDAVTLYLDSNKSLHYTNIADKDKQQSYANILKHVLHSKLRETWYHYWDLEVRTGKNKKAIYGNVYGGEDSPFSTVDKKKAHRK